MMGWIMEEVVVIIAALFIIFIAFSLTKLGVSFTNALLMMIIPLLLGIDRRLERKR